MTTHVSIGLLFFFCKKNETLSPVRAILVKTNIIILVLPKLNSFKTCLYYFFVYFAVIVINLLFSVLFLFIYFFLFFLVSRIYIF